MAGAKSFREFELSWKKFLHHIDRVWNKANDHFVKAPGWFGWSGKYTDLRKRDALLSYLFQARNSDEHSVREIIEHQPGSVTLKPTIPGGVTYIDSMRVRNGVMEFGPGTVGTMEVTPTRTVLLPVKARDGRIYAVPEVHLGEKLADPDCIGLANRAVAFYEDFLKEAENKFVTR
jgi:hypothetical protein